MNFPSKTAIEKGRWIRGNHSSLHPKLEVSIPSELLTAHHGKCVPTKMLFSYTRYKSQLLVQNFHVTYIFEGRFF